MFCEICRTDLSGCTCIDLEIRLDSITNFVYKKCLVCQKHYARCKCTKPNWIASTNPPKITH